jgi:hypothetical protein
MSKADWFPVDGWARAHAGGIQAMGVGGPLGCCGQLELDPAGDRP